MEWVQGLNRAIDYMEENLLNDLTCGEIAGHVNLSSFHFQRCFTLLIGMTVSEYGKLPAVFSLPDTISSRKSVDFLFANKA